ncbi:MAG: transglutaminase family protein [Nocardioides sp.]|uniref:transglutaminase-like domain-containing protein n=1 Tax=Nocardioides sp. TaxID=35761 RepID=UPI003F0ADDD3
MEPADPDLVPDPRDFLVGDDVVEVDHPDVRALAATLRATSGADDEAYARAAFEWVRDEVAHSWDARDPRVTVSASEVLGERVGLCYAKSHLLAALLRAEGVPTGLCYQRLRDDDYLMLHGLVAVHLRGAWHRQDPRGNKPGVDAQFSLEGERLAWPVDPALGEEDLPGLHVHPDPGVVTALRGTVDVLSLCRNGLPGALQAP